MEEVIVANHQKTKGYNNSSATLHDEYWILFPALISQFYDPYKFVISDTTI